MKPDALLLRRFGRQEERADLGVDILWIVVVDQKDLLYPGNGPSATGSYFSATMASSSHTVGRHLAGATRYSNAT